MDHWQIVLACGAILPNLLISIVKRANEAVKELHCIHRQVHHAVVELLVFFRHTVLLSASVVFIHQHSKVLSCIHVERQDTVLEFVKLDVLL